MGAKFGPAGNSESFSAKYKSTVEAPEFLRNMGLDHYEYQCGRGVRVSDKLADTLRKRAQEHKISLSLHAPYFISLSSVDEEKRSNSIDYILQSCEAALKIGADRIVIHSGSCSKMSREEAMCYAEETLKKARQEAVARGYEAVHFCPETMGKVNQLGNLEEVLRLCQIDDTFIPCIDFGHLNARTLGGIKGREDYSNILDKIENELGTDRLKIFHSHFSKIMYTDPGGEKKHLTFEDNVYGPEFEPLMELVAQKNLSPVFICESAGTQAEDALTMKKSYMSFDTERI